MGFIKGMTIQEYVEVEKENYIKEAIGEEFYIDLFKAIGQDHREYWLKEHKRVNGSREYHTSLSKYMSKQIDKLYINILYNKNKDV